MEWLQQYWPLILLGAASIALALWWLVGGEGGTSARVEDAAPPAIVTGPAVAPVDIPPPLPVREPEPELSEPVGPPDTLTRMKGVGPKVAALLNDLGVTRFDQIAAWSPADVDRIDAQLGAFKGRITRDQWIDQARLLAAGDTAAYEARFGKLG